MDIYSFTLLIAIAACCVAAIFLTSGRFRKNARGLRICAFASFGAIAFDLISFLVHYFHDHYGPTLKTEEFLAQHPSFMMIALTSIVLYLLSVRWNQSRDVK